MDANECNGCERKRWCPTENYYRSSCLNREIKTSKRLGIDYIPSDTRIQDLRYTKQERPVGQFGCEVQSTLFNRMIIILNNIEYSFDTNSATARH